MAKRRSNQYPKGWNATRVKRLIAIYDNQTDEEAAAEMSAARAIPGPTTWIEVPNEFLPQVNALVDQWMKSLKRKKV